MLIWLGKQLLGQRDTPGLQHLDKNGNPADGPIRVQVVLVSDAPPKRVEQPAPRTGPRSSENVRGAVQLVG
jgi:hypothetical protein